MPKKKINSEKDHYCVCVFFKKIFIYSHEVGVCIPWPACEGQRATWWSPFCSPILTPVPGIEQIGGLGCQVPLSDELSCL